MKKAKKIGKEQVALIQLQDALELYYKQSYISAITLAGAAEEVLKKLSNHTMSRFVGADVEHNQVDMSFSFLAMMFAGTEAEYDTLSNNQKKKVKKYRTALYHEYNGVKNALKHKDKGEDIVEYNSFKAIAEQHLSNAILNLCYYKGAMPTEYPLIMQYCQEKKINYNSTN